MAGRWEFMIALGLCAVACGPSPASSFQTVRPMPLTSWTRTSRQALSTGRSRVMGLRSQKMMVDETAVTRRQGLARAILYVVGAPMAAAAVSTRSAGAAQPAVLLPAAPLPTQAGGAAVMSAEEVFCDQAVSRLLNANTGQEVYIVGTAHISAVSAELVRDTIRLVRPNKIMVELDSQRVKKRAPVLSSATTGASSDTPAPSSLWDLVKAEWAKPVSLGEKFANVEAGVIGLAISSLYKKLDKMGFSSGQEFIMAIREAEAIGAELILGDRPVDVTLKRLQQSIEKTGFNEVKIFATSQASTPEEQLLSSSLTSDGKDGKDLDAAALASTVEAMKERGNVRQIMNTLKKSLPEVYTALIGERDVYMSNSILKANGKKTVAVVGMAHMDGIERTLAENGFILAPPLDMCAQTS